MRFRIPGTSQPFDLTGCTAVMTLQANYGPSVPAWDTLTSEDGGLTLGGPLGTMAIYLSAVQTGALPVPVLANQQMPVGRGVYDIAITLPSGDIARGLQGTVSVAAAVTLPSGPGGPQ